MHFNFDTIIVGAGPAGCAAAYDLAQADKRVLLIDKRSFPRHKACACGLTRKTLAALRYSVDPVIERRCFHVVLQEAGPAFATGVRLADKTQEVHARTRSPFCAMAVRERFDAFCLDQTLARGAQFLRIESVATLREFPTYIELDIILPDGSTRTLRAPVLIGADGSNGQTRRLAAGLNTAEPPTQLPSTTELSSRPERSAVERPAVGAATNPHSAPTIPVRESRASTLPPEPDWYARGFALEATVPYTALPPQLPAGDHPHDLVFDFSPIAGGYGWLFPKGDHVNIGVGGFVPQKPNSPPTTNTTPTSSTNESATRTLLANYTRTKLGVDLPPQVTGQYLGLGGHTYTPTGRVLLAGDAAGMVDPLTGEGIHSAIVSGQAAAAAILEAKSNATTEDLAAAYTRHLRSLQDTLAFSHRAAQSFYREPGRGMRAVRIPILRRLILRTYADGLPQTELIATLVRKLVR
jgi:flavin-dependent dehydrogenase